MEMNKNEFVLEITSHDSKNIDITSKIIMNINNY